MGVSQHPSAGLRSNYAIGNLAPGAALAVNGHIELCETCRLSLGRAERTYRNARSHLKSGASSEAAVPATGLEAFGPLPAAVRALPVGRWRRVRNGVRAAPLTGAAGLGEAVYLVAAKPAAPLPLPPAAEFVLVLDGALHDGTITYKAGDFLEGGAARGSARRAGARIGCLCLVVGDDTLYRRPFLDWIRDLTKA